MSDKGRFGWLAAGVVLLLFANGRWIFPPAAWLAPVCWLVFLERSRSWMDYLVGFVLYLLVEFVVWVGIIPAPGFLYFMVASIFALVYFLPLAVHRALAPRVAGFWSTLVFPLALVSIEFVFQRWISPYGTWASFAYTQTDYLPLLQLASLTGVAGIAFLGAWLGSVAAWTLRPEQATRARWTAVSIYAFVLLAVLAYGQIRLARPEAEAELVRTAGIVPSADLMGELEAVLAPVRRGEQISLASLDTIAGIAARLNDDLFARSRREARTGARLVAWSETAGRVLKSDEPALLERASRLAAQEGVNLVLAYGVWAPDTQPPFENKTVAVDASGRVAWHYNKTHPIIGAESSLMGSGDGIIPALDTPFGRIGSVICHDLDFPALLRQANRSGIGLIVAPSADWREITPLHADMAILRAIEGGYWLLRPTSGGRSIATDTRGRTLARVDFAEDAMVAYLAASPVSTVYGIVGDTFAWLCVAGFAWLALSALVLRREG
jgi:apolipoprotein N-acyltransferase